MNEQEVESNRHQGRGTTVTSRRTGRRIRTRFHHDGTEIRNYSVDNARVEEAATSAVEENNNVNHKSNNCS